LWLAAKIGAYRLPVYVTGSLIASVSLLIEGLVIEDLSANASRDHAGPLSIW
jgi:hypothetical protein